MDYKLVKTSYNNDANFTPITVFNHEESSNNSQSINPPFIHSLSFHPSNNDTLLVGLGNGSISVLNISRKKKKKIYKQRTLQAHNWSVTAIDLFVSASLDGSVIKWDEEFNIGRKIETGIKVNAMRAKYGDITTCFLGGIRQSGISNGDVEVVQF